MNAQLGPVVMQESILLDQTNMKANSTPNCFNVLILQTLFEQVDETSDILLVATSDEVPQASQGMEVDQQEEDE